MLSGGHTHAHIIDITAGRIFEIGSTGISSSKGHILQRSRCLSEFSSMYGHMPLVATTVKAVDGRSSWLW
jgi:hypothetical protein